MRNKRTIAKIISMLLVISSLIPILLVSASAGVGEDYDLSRPGSLNTVTLNSADILEKMLGEQLCEAERMYLVSYGDFEIKYDAGITTSYVQASCTNGSLAVAAYEYSYQTESGATVVWVPKRATINGETKELEKSEDTYDTVFEGVSTDDAAAAVAVVYALSIEISSELANSLVNRAYFDAPVLKAELEAKTAEYEAALEEYNRAKAEYDDYVIRLEKYSSDLSVYNEYLTAKRVYDLTLKKYNQYLAAKAIYDTKLEAYNEYEAKLKQYEEDFKKYSEYRNAYIEYEKDLAEYNALLADVNKCRAQLAIIESTKTPMTELNRTIFSDVCLSTLVDTVLEQRDAYEKTGRYDVSPAALDLAEECTGILRRLLNEYFSLETEVARYNYYSANYESFKYGFTGLFQSLYYFANVKNSVLMGDLETMLKLSGQSTDKIPKLMILIAMLYTVTSTITDGPVYTISPALVTDKDPNYKQKTVTLDSFKCYYQTYSQILGCPFYLSDTNSAAPVNGGFPAISTEPTPPAKVDEPTAPTYVSEPVKPTEVKNPGDAPVEVKNPGEAPDAVVEPVSPIAPEYTAEQLALISAYDSANIAKRELEFDTSALITVETVLDKRFVNVDTVTVKFHYSDECDPWITTVDKGTLADYGGPVPVIPEDVRAKYVFRGWQTKDGALVDLGSATEDLELYPRFDEIIKNYDITFIVDGRETTVNLPYGEIPAYTGTPEKPGNNEKRYIFEGWQPEIAPVSGDAVYEAVFTEKDMIPPQNGVTTVFDGEDFTYKVSFSASSTVDISAALELSQLETDIIIETRAARVEIDPLTVAELKAAGIAKVAINVNSVSSLSKSVELLLYDGENSEIGNIISPLSSGGDSAVLIKVTLRAPIGSHERMRVRYLNAEGVYQFTDCMIEENDIVFDAVPGISYSVGSEYLAHTVSIDAAQLSLAQKSFFAGDSVDVSATISEGKRLVKLVYLYGNGNEVKITDSRFTMPAADVTVMAVVEQITYTVTFINDGAVIKTYRCPHGALATPPTEAPKKASDGEYSYIFTGWSSSFDPITCDTEYTAVYEKKVIEKSDAPAAQGLTLYQIITIAKYSVIAVVVIGGMWIAVVIIRRVRGD